MFILSNTESSDITQVTLEIKKGDFEIQVASTANLVVGQYVDLYQRTTANFGYRGCVHHYRVLTKTILKIEQDRVVVKIMHIALLNCLIFHLTHKHGFKAFLYTI
ncbi:hypothetical protein ABI125_11955 [Tamlana crocina]